MKKANLKKSDRNSGGKNMERLIEEICDNERLKDVLESLEEDQEIESEKFFKNRGFVNSPKYYEARRKVK